MQVPAFTEQSYAAGWCRTQLPNTVGSMGVDPSLVDEMLVLANRTSSRLALWNQSSQVGATSFVMLLPETESALPVLTNTMAPNDADDWIGQLLVKTVLESHLRNHYVRLTSASVDGAKVHRAQRED